MPLINLLNANQHRRSRSETEPAQSTYKKCVVEEARDAALARLRSGSGCCTGHWSLVAGQTGRFRFPLEVKSVSGCRKNAERRAIALALPARVAARVFQQMEQLKIFAKTSFKLARSCTFQS